MHYPVKDCLEVVPGKGPKLYFYKALPDGDNELVVRCSVRGNDAKEITHMSIKTMWVKMPGTGSSPIRILRDKPAGDSQKLPGKDNVLRDGLGVKKIYPENFVPGSDFGLVLGLVVCRRCAGGVFLWC